MAAPRLDPSSLLPLFQPDSVAVIGASSDPTKLGSIPVAHMKASGFKGPLYPVNLKAATIQDLPAYASLRAVPGPVDLAIIAVAEQHVLAALRDCALKGVRAAVLFTSGFAEVSEAGRQAQEEIKALARGAQMRLLGPNCMGLVNFTNRLVATFHLAFGPALAPAGRMGLISQSGAFGGVAYQVAQDRGLGYSLILTTGNEGDVDVADGVAYLAQDPGTAVIMIYLEGSRDGAKLAAALALARQRRKPVVCLKVGRTEAGVAAIASHTAALAGTDEIFDAMFRQHGVHRAQTMEEFFDIGYAAAQARALPRNERLGVITVSGGVGVLMADAAAGYDLDVAPASPSLQDGIRAMVPFAATRNPIDVTGQVVSDMGILDRAMEMTAKDGGYPSLACFLGSIGRSPVNAPRSTPPAASSSTSRPTPCAPSPPWPGSAAPSTLRRAPSHGCRRRKSSRRDPSTRSRRWRCCSAPAFPPSRIAWCAPPPRPPPMPRRWDCRRRSRSSRPISRTRPTSAVSRSISRPAKRCAAPSTR